MGYMKMYSLIAKQLLKCNNMAENRNFISVFGGIPLYIISTKSVEGCTGYMHSCLYGLT
jgi:hypothetical protein